MTMREVYAAIDGVTVLVGTFPESQVADAHQRLRDEFGEGVTLDIQPAFQNDWGMQDYTGGVIPFVDRKYGRGE